MDAWLQLIVDSLDPNQLRILLFLCLGNMGLGALAAFFKNQFNLTYLKEMWKRIAGMGIAYVVTATVTVGLADFQPVLTAIWVGLVADLSARLLLNLKDLGLPIPEGLVRVAGRAP